MKRVLPGNGKVKVFVVDDSTIFRNYWRRMFLSDCRFEIVGTAANGQEAIDNLDSLNPDLVLLDLEMPVLNGIEAIPELLKKKPQLKIIVASALTSKGSVKAIEALTVGATDCLAKPNANNSSVSLDSIKSELFEKIFAIIGVAFANNESDDSNILSLEREGSPIKSSNFSALAIGCSTGGPKALDVFFKTLPPEVKQPIFLTQHMPKYFITALAERISKDSGRICVEPLDGEKIESGKIYIAPGDVHMLVRKAADSVVVKLSSSPPENFCRPAVDPMFGSLSSVYESRLLALVLTGMGEDGLQGAKQVVKNGGRVIAQDEKSSIVWGMPGAVAKARLASEIISLDDLGTRVGEMLIGSSGKVKYA